jgi:anti-anti-sigma regulatory factor
VAHGRDRTGWPLRVVVPARVEPEEIERLCERVRAACCGRTRPVLCDLGSVAVPDLMVIDALARMRLAARRAGGSLVVVRLRPDLAQLVALAGLGTVLLEPDRQGQGREQRGVGEDVEAPHCAVDNGGHLEGQGDGRPAGAGGPGVLGEAERPVDGMGDET